MQIQSIQKILNNHDTSCYIINHKFKHKSKEKRNIIKQKFVAAALKY